MSVPKRSYTAGHFELQIDGDRSPAYLKSIEGGHVKANVIEEPIGPSNMRIKHVSTLEIVPFSIEVGLSETKEILKWIQSSWRMDPTRRSGQVNHGNFDYDRVFEHEFSESLITETTFPALDGKSTEGAYLKLKLQPEGVKGKKVSSGKIQGQTGSKQKRWSCAGFRLNIDGLEEMSLTNRLESFTIKQGIKKHYIGKERFPQIEPVNITFPNVSGTIALEFADRLLEWHQNYIISGMQDPKAQKTGSIEFLGPKRGDDVLFRINLFEVGVPGLEIVQSTANAGQIKRVKFDLSVGRMDIDDSVLAGME